MIMPNAERRTPKPNFQNRTLFQGDNLPFLQALNSETFDLVATDPPFNKSKDFHATPDSLAAGASFSDRWRWADTIHQDWVDELEDDHPKVWRVIQSIKDNGDESMAAFICWLAVRMLECHRLLKPTGSLMLHIDHTAQAYAKVMLDAIFGRDNFINEIAWCYTTPANTKRWFPRKHDTILWYAKGKSWTFNPDTVRVPYKRGSKLDGKGWDTGATYTQDEVSKGKVVMDWWSDLTPVQRLIKEMTGYPTQKPLKLLERQIAAASNPGDWVLDPHAGCATTPVAAERLGRQWVAMDLWTDCGQMIETRLKNETQLWTPDMVHMTKAVPIRTDNGETATVYLPELKGRVRKAPRYNKDQMMKILLDQWGFYCWGCGYEPPHQEHFELDHITPKAAGGHNDLDNRAPLCGPCNRRKSNLLTLDGLRRANKKLKYWYGNPPIDERIPIRTAIQWAQEHLLNLEEQQPRLGSRL